MKALIQKIKELINKIKSGRTLKREFKDFKKELEKKSGRKAARIAVESGEWAEFYWGGKKQKFFIHKINFQELLTCGRFPNVLYQFLKGLTGALGAEDLKMPESDLKRLKEEEDEFRHELAERTMIFPSYRECYDAITELLGNKEAAREDVIPKNFLDDVFLFYLNEWESEIKKKSAQLTLSGLGGLPNTGEQNPQAT